MFSISDLPLLNAILNSTSAVLLLAGHAMMKRGRIKEHKLLMISTFVVSILFLASYLSYHAVHGSEPFRGTGWTRPLYFTILTSHSILAACIVPLSIITLARGLRRKDALHRAIAKWTYPIWLYVSITGVLIYLMLYRLFV